jgi:hypothetical protein
MDEWIDIVAYRDFCDVPRIFLIVVDKRTILLDCPFDERLDEYPDEYAVYELRDFHLDALPRDWTELSRQGADYKGRVQARNVIFDASKRKQIKCAELRGLLA